tara:strand:+ start:5860 stop:6321 length:462 start_codon:yes stop_codon:yes gene_type:complete
MAGSVNKVILLGNVGKDPEIRATQSGSKLASFSIATSKRWKDKQTQEYKDKTEWHKIVIFGEGLTSIVEKYVKKGSKIYIEGELQTRKWEDQDGKDRYTTEIVLQGYNSTLTLLDSKGTDSSISNKNEQENSNKIANSTPEEQKSDLDDEIPF